MRTLFLILLFVIKIHCNQFKDASYSELLKRSFELNGKFATTVTAFDLLGVDNAKLRSTVCSPAIIRVTDVSSQMIDKQRPQILISGEIHGNERMGPSTSLFIAQLLVNSASCEIDKSIESCKLLDMDGISSKQRIWLAFLSTRRDTFIIPTANCLGYILNRRDDAGIDPNRDFSYGRLNSECMQSTTAKIMNALLSQTIMQIVVTFHGGMVAIGYEWGSMRNHVPNDKSPDDAANQDIARQMSEYAGTFQHEKLYPVGTINSLVYPLHGAMEDWLYAGGWDKTQMTQCDPVPEHKKVKHENKNKNLRNRRMWNPLLEDSSAGQPKARGLEPLLRAMVFLVETSDLKQPPANTLGRSEGVLSTAGGNGHISRNARLGLMAVDIAQPYICLTSLSIEKRNSINNRITIHLNWYVGGSFRVDATWWSLHEAVKGVDVSTADWSVLLDSLHPPINTANSGYAMNVTATQTGLGRWATPSAEDPPEFRATAHLAPSELKMQVGTVYWFVAWAVVDQHWGASKQGKPDNLPPQSYLVNSRTIIDSKETEEFMRTDARGEKIVVSRRHWPSDPIAMALDDQAGLLTADAVLHCAWWDRQKIV